MVLVVVLNTNIPDINLKYQKLLFGYSHYINSTKISDGFKKGNRGNRPSLPWAVFNTFSIIY